MDAAKMMPKPNMMGATQQDVMWHAGAQNPAQAHGAVSVVATVYSNVPRYGGAPQSFNTNAMHQNSASNVFGVCNGPSTGASYGVAPGLGSKPSAYCPDGTYHSYDHQPYSSQPGPPEYGSTAPQQAALNAAQVAAAAVATATATAVAIDRSQFQPYHPGPQPDSYANASYQSPTGVVPPSPYGAGPRMIQQRPQVPSPYIPTVRATRGQSGIRYPIPNGKNVSAVPTPFPNGQQHTPTYTDQFPGNQPTMGLPNRIQSPGVYPNNMAMGAYNPRMPASRLPHYPLSPSAVGTPGPHIPNAYMSQLPTYGHQISQQAPAPPYQNIRTNVMCGSMTSLPNNPTPPLTPAVGGMMPTPPGYAMGPALSGAPVPMVDVKPAINAQEAEPRITFALRDGILLQPFRLEHNAPVSQHVFILDDRTYHQLCTNPNIDIQLKCFHAEDKTMSNNWPHNANIQICVNGSPVAVRVVERPLYIKALCQKQKNTLQIAVQQCCCSHLFLLSVVNRPTVDTVVRQLVRQRLLSPEHCIEKIRSFFHTGEVAHLRNTENGGNPEIVQMSINMSLKCPITMKRIELPARGQECRHPQCFDLRSYLAMNKERSTWLCPICKRLAMWDSLEIDQYVWGILTNLNNCDVDEVTIDGTAAWKPVGRQASNGALKEESDMPCSSAKRFKPDPGANGNICTWGQPTLQSSLSAPAVNTGLGQHLQSTPSCGPGPGYNRTTSNVLSPYYSGGSPSGSSNFMNANPATPAACYPQSMPSSGSVGSVPSMPSNFTGPLTPKASLGPLTPHNSRCGPATPATPQQQQLNPPSVGPPPRSVGNPPSVDNPAKGTYGSVNAYGGQKQQSLQQQSSVDASFSGSAPYTPVSVSSASSQSTNTLVNTSADAGSDFPDFTFDASDLLGGGDMTQTGTSLFNDPEELMKYLADDSDFGGFGLSGQSSGFSGSSSTADKQRWASQSTSAADPTSSRRPSSSVTTDQQATSNGFNRSTAPPEFSSVDDIMLFLDK